MKKTQSTKRALLSSVMALLICFTMLLGTTFAWFTDSVTSKGNIIQTGELKIGFEWADGTVNPADATWTDASEGAIFDYANWEPGYAVARHLKVSNKGTLALDYEMRIVANGIVTKLADVIDVYYFNEEAALVRNDLTDAKWIGTLKDVLGTTKNLSNKINGSLVEGADPDIHTIVLKMNENADNEYQNMDLGCTFSVELIATQSMYEADSFGTTYDEKALSANVPAALVTSVAADEEVSYTKNSQTITIVREGRKINATAGIGGAVSEITMDTLYKFEPTQTEEHMNSSEYKYYIADFVVSADKYVPANTIALAGYYDAWCSLYNYNWVALSNDGLPVNAGQEICLVEAMGQGNIAVHYKDICQYGNDGLGFMCGAVDLTGENAGTTLTVKLCLFETTADPNGSSTSYEKTDSEPIVIGEFKYTFEHKAEYVAEQLAAGEDVTLLNDVVFDKKITIDANADCVLDLNGHTLSGAFDNNGGSALIENNGTLTVKNGTIVSLAEYPDVDWGTEGFPTYATNTISNRGTLIIGDGAVIENQTAVGGASYAVDNYAGATLIVEDGATILAKDVAIRMFSGSATAENKVVVNGGEITGKRAIWVQLPSSNSAVAPLTTVEINGGVLTGTSGLAFYSYSYGNSFANTTVTIAGGTFEGDVQFGGGYKGDTETVTITGGTFNGYLGRWLANDGWEDIAKP